MKGLVLTAGRGSRLGVLTKTRSKSMIPIAGKPIIQYTIENLRDAGILEIIIVVGKYSEQIKDFLGNGHDFGVNIEYIEQKSDTYGVGEAILSAKKLLNKEESFLLYHPDTLSKKTIIERTVNNWKKLKADLSIAVKLVDFPQYYGVVEIDSESNVKRYVEKPAEGVSKSHYANAGVFIGNLEFLSILEEERVFEKTLQKCIEKGLVIKASVWEKEWVELTYPWDILSANKFIITKLLDEGSFIHKSAKISPLAKLSGLIYIGKNVQVLAGTTIKGPCFIDDNSFIGSNVLIRGVTSIGKQATIGHAVEVKNSVIFDKVQIGRLSFVGDSVIGQHVELGAGSQAWNTTSDRSPIYISINGEKTKVPLQKFGVVMGDNSILGINVSLYPGIFIGQNSTIEPGVVIKENVPPNSNVILKQQLKIEKSNIKKEE
ncbi:MAG: bifunctional sugar-1-phosphate nucleotidylyltransferase/acetyltransferase [Candidatus Ranarchaeia archaeon]